MQRVIDAAKKNDVAIELNSRYRLPGLQFVNVYKTMLAEQTGDDAWLQVRAPLCPLDSDEELAVRAAYRAIGAALEKV